MKKLVLKGKAIRYGRDIDTDAIIPARYLSLTDPVDLGRHCMEDYDSQFAGKASGGGIIVGEENFGCGSSREHAPMAIMGAGISCVVAKSFARIFYRNAINLGLPILESPEAVDGISEGDLVEVDPAKGEIRNMTTGMVYQAAPFSEFIQGIIGSGGLIKHTRRLTQN